MAEVNVICNVIQRNDKTYLIVTAVNTKFEIDNIATHFHSESLNAIINGLVNKIVSTNWRGFYRELKSELEDYICRIVQTIISPVVDKIALQDFFLQ